MTGLNMKILRVNWARFVLFSLSVLKRCHGDTALALFVSAVQFLANPEHSPAPRLSGHSTPFRLAADDLAQRTGLAASTIRRYTRQMLESGTLIPVNGDGQPITRKQYARRFRLDYAQVPVRSGRLIKLYQDLVHLAGGDYAAALLLAIYESWFCYEQKTVAPSMHELRSISGLCRDTIRTKQELLLGRGFLLLIDTGYILDTTRLQEAVSARYSTAGAQDTNSHDKTERAVAKTVPPKSAYLPGFRGYREPVSVTDAERDLLVNAVEQFGTYADGRSIKADESIIIAIAKKVRYYRTTISRAASILYQAYQRVQRRASYRPSEPGWFVTVVERELLATQPADSCTALPAANAPRVGAHTSPSDGVCPFCGCTEINGLGLCVQCSQPREVARRRVAQRRHTEDITDGKRFPLTPRRSRMHSVPDLLREMSPVSDTEAARPARGESVQRLKTADQRQYLNQQLVDLEHELAEHKVPRERRHEAEQLVNLIRSELDKYREG
jgi:hypothetical protein